MKRFGWITVMAMTSMLYACAGADEMDPSGSDQEAALEHESAALKIDPCALVRCPAGTQCEVQDGRARCVPNPQPECAADKECRLFSNYCAGCECLALSDAEVDPVCKGDIVACFVDPCRAQEAVCVRGQCVLGGGF